jgi:hypothetical protein
MPIQNTPPENIEIVYPGQADKNYAYRGSSKAELEAIPELEKSYPEFSNWKELPAWGFYLRHVDGLEMYNVKLRVDGQDYRPAIVSDDVTGLRLENVTVSQDGAEGKEQIIKNNTTETR